MARGADHGARRSAEPVAGDWWASFFDDQYVRAWTAAGSFERSEREADDVAARLGPAPLDVLDVPCGFGRIAGRLAERGHRVTGVDLSAEQLAIAEQRFPGPTYVRGDMRSPPAGPFDAVLNLFSSFGYFAQRDDDLAALRGWFAVLRPGGVLLMDLMHRDGLAYLLGREQTPMDAGPVHETGETDWVEGIRTATVTYGPMTRSFRIRLYTATELLRALRRTGFTGVEVSGDLRGTTTFSPATRLVIRAVKGRHAAA